MKTFYSILSILSISINIYQFLSILFKKKFLLLLYYILFVWLFIYSILFINLCLLIFVFFILKIKINNIQYLILRILKFVSNINTNGVITFDNHLVLNLN